MTDKAGKPLMDMTGLEFQSDIPGVSEFWDDRPAPKFVEADGGWRGRYWQRAGPRWVHPDIPNPINEEDGELGWRSIRGDGGWYDYETGAKMTPVSLLRIAHRP